MHCVDKLGEYEKAYGLYKRALEYFVTGLKYEQNATTKKMIQERVEGYMKRAEEIKSVLSNAAAPPGGGGGGKGSYSFFIGLLLSLHIIYIIVA